MSTNFINKLRTSIEFSIENFKQIGPEVPELRLDTHTNKQIGKPRLLVYIKTWRYMFISIGKKLDKQTKQFRKEI